MAIKDYFGKNWRITKEVIKDSINEQLEYLIAEPGKTALAGLGLFIGGESLSPAIDAAFQFAAPQTTQEQVVPEMPSSKLMFNLGYNGLENGVNQEGSMRTRMLNSVGVSAGNFHLDYNGLNEINDLNNNTYFGRHVVSAGHNSSPLDIGIVVKTVKGEVLDVKTGVRNTTIPESVADYGSIDVTVDGESANVDVFTGKVIGNGSVELYHEVEIPFDGTAAHYTEVQGNVDITKHLAGFGRIEIPNFKLNEANFMMGFATK